MAYFRGTISKYDFSQILPDSTNNETLFSTHVTNNITGNGSSVFQEGEDGFFNYIIFFVGDDDDDDDDGDGDGDDDDDDDDDDATCVVNK